jgi:hypothetical protein
MALINGDENGNTELYEKACLQKARTENQGAEPHIFKPILP